MHLECSKLIFILHPIQSAILATDPIILISQSSIERCGTTLRRVVDVRVKELQEILQNMKNLRPSGNNILSSVESNILCITRLSPNRVDGEDSAQIIVVGRFANFVNNSGIGIEKVHINVVDSYNTQQSVWE